MDQQLNGSSGGDVTVTNVSLVVPWTAHFQWKLCVSGTLIHPARGKMWCWVLHVCDVAVFECHLWVDEQRFTFNFCVLGKESGLVSTYASHVVGCRLGRKRSIGIAQSSGPVGKHESFGSDSEPATRRIERAGTRSARLTVCIVCDWLIDWMNANATIWPELNVCARAQSMFLRPPVSLSAANPAISAHDNCMRRLPTSGTCLDMVIVNETCV